MNDTNFGDRVTATPAGASAGARPGASLRRAIGPKISGGYKMLETESMLLPLRGSRGNRKGVILTPMHFDGPGASVGLNLIDIIVIRPYIMLLRFKGSMHRAFPKRLEGEMALDVAQLLAMSQAQLDDLFTKSPAGPIPDGAAKGTAIIAPGTVFSKEIAELINIFDWRGKTFDGQRGVLTNRVSILGFSAIVAEVYKGESWMDKKECIVLDYSKTSMVAHYIRDEIRLIGPNFYLGKVYWGQKRLIDFCLDFNKP